jgi:S-adenosylmethionine hydrolase
MAIVTLITDYGYRDYYVGAVKGVILGLAPEVRIVDITHAIEPHDIVAGAMVLRQVWGWFPPGTIHVAVVDPGVGSDREIVVGRFEGRYVVAPDNGLITFVHRELPVDGMHIVHKQRSLSGEPSATFHGRDIMGPVAAALAQGAAPSDFGPATDRPVLLDVAEATAVGSDGVCGSVLYVDHFGTLVTSVRHMQLAKLNLRRDACEVRIDGKVIGPIRSTFSDVEVGEPVALIGSCGHLEIAVNQGRAVEMFGRAERIEVVRGKDEG